MSILFSASMRLAPLTLLIFLTVSPRAQSATGPDAVRPPTWAVEAGVDVPTAYYYRGYRVSDQGPMVQPYVTFSLGQWAVRDARLVPYLGVWNNISREVGPHVPVHYSEIDLVVGTRVELEDVSAGIEFDTFSSPSGSFSNVAEVGLVVDAHREISPSVSVDPSVSVYHEVLDTEGPNGTYALAGVTPSWSVPRTRLTLSLPLAAGLSLDRYYTDERGGNAFVGYGSVAWSAMFAVSERISIEGVVEYLRFGAASVRAAAGGSPDVAIAHVGVTFER